MLMTASEHVKLVRRVSQCSAFLERSHSTLAKSLPAAASRAQLNTSNLFRMGNASKSGAICNISRCSIFRSTLRMSRNSLIKVCNVSHCSTHEIRPELGARGITE
eukprot:7110389-Prymnesium_polylepis.1